MKHVFTGKFWLLAVLLVALTALSGGPVLAAGKQHFAPIDVFDLEYASDPRISPDGASVAYVRNAFNIMTDRRQRSLWLLKKGGAWHRPLDSSGKNPSSPRWSPSGDRLLYVSSDDDGKAQLYVRYMDNGTEARLTHLTASPSSLSWSPDGKWIAFAMRLPGKAARAAAMPKAPRGAKWAAPVRIVDKLQFHLDGVGFLPGGYSQIFVLPADGGTPRQLTKGNFNHGSRASWTADSGHLIISANRHPDWEYQGNDSELYEIDIASGALKALTDRRGPDLSPAVSPGGKRIAYVGYDDRLQGYQRNRLYVMNRDGSGRRELAAGLDRSIGAPVWSADGSGIYFQYTSEGITRVGYVSLDGSLHVAADKLGGMSLGRPYSTGAFTVSNDGRIAFVTGGTQRPADVAVGEGGGEARQLTHLNSDLLGNRGLGPVEEIRYKSSADGREIEGWIIKPPNFDASRKYPLILEIHGGPFASYGPVFSAEDQLYAAAGYVVLYTNPRGSTSYGEEFGNLIHHNYPSQDFDDLMSGVDAVVAKGYIDADNLYVTGGSGGGVLTAWIVGHTDRFRAAVVAKPVINWTSFVLTSDFTGFFYKYWFAGPPWEEQENYWKRSPLAYVGNVTTPTMVLSGEADRRTPITEAEQFYVALKIRKVDSKMVRIPGAFHGITARPSNLIAKTANILDWFGKHRPAAASGQQESTGGMK